MNQRKVAKVLTGMLVREGGGVKLQRYIGMERDNPYEPMLLFDFFDSDNPLDYIAGFPSHPHRGFETITYLLDGEIEHQDNHGHHGVIGPGGVQWMTAGRGIIHSEMPRESARLTGLQLWLNLPAAKKMIPPAYQEYTAGQLAYETLPNGVEIKLIAGETATASSPVKGIATAPLFFDIKLPPHSIFVQQVPSGHQCLVFVLQGGLLIDAQAVASKEMAILSDGDEVNLGTQSEACHCILIAARKLGEPIARLGPFVMNTQEEVFQAVEDFRNQRF
ncbi:pirin-like protein [Legionella birminghamensis]|uniref:Pirin-like protein n=1 Tax=Legionella birminghamensis TaxID=28083 RepID=A0A378I5H7_9GAMM|nr:pirin family protein [Legionella birminghamensis]KTC68731.1 pirin-like protein [Legionella birminghamensis]STX30283.1 pirin-like protein [Legionella birminghamensis]